MFFSRVRIQAENFDPKIMADFLTGDGYSLHQLLWKLFPHDPDAERDFIYRSDNERGWPQFYVVSRRSPCHLPGLFTVESKEYTPKLYSGQRLAFSLRVNPVVTRKNDLKKRLRHDIVMDAKHRLKKSGSDIHTPELVGMEGCKWLEKRAEKSGFAFEPRSVNVEGYVQHCFAKSGKSKNIRFSTLDFNGLLTVVDPDCFINILYKGIGPAKSFGCGLMLIRKV